MDLNKLPKTTTKKKRRLGLGLGSGRGKTAGRGTKGQKARGKIPSRFEGGALPLIKRLPMLRGRARNKAFKKKPIVVNVKYLNFLAKGETVNLDSLIAHKIVSEVDARGYGVKILGEGEVAVALKVTLPCSKGAKRKIEKAGGTVVYG